jgi:Mor family transcriptional regulator
MKGKGWEKEPARHSLAARGVSSVLRDVRKATAPYAKEHTRRLIGIRESEIEGEERARQIVPEFDKQFGSKIDKLYAQYKVSEREITSILRESDKLDNARRNAESIQQDVELRKLEKELGKLCKEQFMKLWNNGDKLFKAIDDWFDKVEGPGNGWVLSVRMNELSPRYKKFNDFMGELEDLPMFGDSIV